MADLRLVDVGGAAVAHGARLNATLTLQVALTMKLFANTLRPLAIQIQRFGRITQVGAV